MKYQDESYIQHRNSHCSPKILPFFMLLHTSLLDTITNCIRGRQHGPQKQKRVRDHLGILALARRVAQELRLEHLLRAP